MRFKVVTIDKVYWYRTQDEMEKKIRECIVGPYIIWPNYSFDAEKAKVSTSGWQVWERGGSWWLTDPCGETRPISWGEFHEAIYFENFVEFDRYKKAQQK